MMRVSITCEGKLENDAAFAALHKQLAHAATAHGWRCASEKRAFRSIVVRSKRAFEPFRLDFDDQMSFCQAIRPRLIDARLHRSILRTFADNTDLFHALEVKVRARSVWGILDFHYDQRKTTTTKLRPRPYRRFRANRSR